MFLSWEYWQAFPNPTPLLSLVASVTFSAFVKLDILVILRWSFCTQQELKGNFKEGGVEPIHIAKKHFIFQLSGVALVIVGAWTLVFENKYTVLLGSSWFLIIVGLMIGTGGLIIIVSICGCYGVVKEHRYFLISVSSYHCHFILYSIAKYIPVLGGAGCTSKEWRHPPCCLLS